MVPSAVVSCGGQIMRLVMVKTVVIGVNMPSISRPLLQAPGRGKSKSTPSLCLGCSGLVLDSSRHGGEAPGAAAALGFVILPLKDGRPALPLDLVGQLGIIVPRIDVVDNTLVVAETKTLVGILLVKV